MNKFTTLDEYQEAARKTDQNAKVGLDALNFDLLGLFGEVGSLLSALKKKQRDKEAILGYRAAIDEEFGDALWYLSNIASRATLKLNRLAQNTKQDLTDWDELTMSVTFEAIQVGKDSAKGPDSPEFEEALLALAAKTGMLLRDCHAGGIEGNRDSLSGHLVEIFRSMIRAANIAEVDLGLVADKNIKKNRSRWPEERIFTSFFDEEYDEFERFPRQFNMDIIEIHKDGKPYVIQRRNDVNIGNAITDNRMVADEYRFHDVFHLAYVAILGWSPTLRALFRLKRKSQAKVDEAEDGARAVLVDEAVSNIVFQHAQQLNFYEGIPAVDYSLLKTIKDFVRGWEVEKCPLWMWEKAILDGYAAFRELKIHRKGRIAVDMNKRSLRFVRI